MTDIFREQIDFHPGVRADVEIVASAATMHGTIISGAGHRLQHHGIDVFREKMFEFQVKERFGRRLGLIDRANDVVNERSGAGRAIAQVRKCRLVHGSPPSQYPLTTARHRRKRRPRLGKVIAVNAASGISKPATLGPCRPRGQRNAPASPPWSAA